MRDAGCGAGSFRVVFVLKILFYFSFSISFFFVYTFFILSFSFYYFIVCVLSVYRPTLYIPYLFLTFTVYSPHPYFFTILLFSPSLFSFQDFDIPPILTCRPPTINYRLPTINYRPSTIANHLYDPPSRIFTLLHSYTLLHFLHFFLLINEIRF